MKKSAQLSDLEEFGLASMRILEKAQAWWRGAKSHWGPNHVFKYQEENALASACKRLEQLEAKVRLKGEHAPRCALPRKSRRRT
jgi:hypothetical protein